MPTAGFRKTLRTIPLLLALGGCRPEPAATAPATAAAPAGDPAAALAPPAPAPPPQPSPLPVRSAVALEPSGPAPLSDRDENVVDPASTFRVELEGRLLDVRMVLLDERDALVPAASSREVAPVTRLELAPASPLVPASRYVLRLEGIGASRPADGLGRALSPVSFALVAAGDPPPPPRRRRR